MAFVPGLREGYYSVQPKQMCVNLPKNIDDHDILDDVEPEDMPLSTPTNMSYFVVRLEFSELARMIVDAQPPPWSESKTISAGDFIVLGNRIEESLRRLPAYFRLENADDAEVKEMHRKMPALTMQRAIMNLGAQVAVIRLHRPYLFRKSPSPPFHRSRDLCLQAARQLLKIRQSMNNIRSSLAFARSRISLVVHHLFVATLVLAMDLCFNKISDDRAREERRQEVREACSILEDARGASPMAADYMAPLLDILRKHKISLQEPDQRIISNNATRQYATSKTLVKDKRDVGSGVIAPADASGPLATGYSAQDGNTGTIDDDTSWESALDFPTMLDSVPDWDELFADIDSTYTF